MIVAIDPGVTTGVAWWHEDLPDDEQRFGSAQFNEDEFYTFIENYIGNHITHLQVEMFVINAATVRKTVVYDSLYLIGFLRYMAHVYCVPLAFSKPADVMASFPDSALRRSGWYNKGRGHANDAARHLAWYCVKSRILPGSLFLP